MHRANRMRTAVEEDGIVLGAESKLADPAMVEVYGGLGLDFVWVDFEHGGPSPYDSTTFENLTRAAELAGTDLLVRVPEGNPSLIRKLLDAGVRNILVPRVASAEEVERAVKATRFYFGDEMGERGMASGRSSTWGDKEDDYVSAEDNSVNIGVMIEKTEAVEALDDILSVPELGFVFIGSNDLSVSLGQPLEKDTPTYLDTVKTIEKKCASAGVAMGAATGSVEATKSKIADGYKILRISKGEAAAVREIVGKRLEELADYR